MKMEHLRGRIHAIRGGSVSLGNGATLATANSLFIDDKVKVVIDPAADASVLRQLGQGRSVEYCLISHSHPDHFCSYRLFPNARCLLHEDERTVSSRGRILPGFVSPDPKVRNRAFSREMGLAQFVPHGRFKDNDVFDLGDTTVRVIHTPGHTKGHCCFYFPRERILYSSDFDLSAIGPWYGQDDSSIEDFLASIEKLRALPADLWVTGHRKWIVHGNAADRLEPYITRIAERDRRILRCLHRKRSLRGLSRLGLIQPIPLLERNPWMYKAERVMIHKHLVRAMTLGVVQRGRLGRWRRAEDGRSPGGNLTESSGVPGRRRAAARNALRSVAAHSIRLVRLYHLAWLRFFVRTGYRMKVRGAERVAQSQNWIITYHYNEIRDVFLLLATLPTEAALRCIAPLPTGKALPPILARVLFFGLLRVLPVRQINAASTLQSCITSLREGYTLLLPSTVRGRTRRGAKFYKEIGYMACRSRTPILPVLVRETAWSPGSGQPWGDFRRTLRVRMGEPIDPSDFQVDERTQHGLGLYRKLGRSLQAELG